MVLKKRKKVSKAKKRPVTHRKKVRLAIECSPIERRHMKMLAASEDKTLNEFILESVRMRLKKCSRSHTPNAETAKALQDAKRGEDLIEFDSIEDFFKSLEK
jgi:hypothetical protein